MVIPSRARNRPLDALTRNITGVINPPCERSSLRSGGQTTEGWPRAERFRSLVYAPALTLSFLPAFPVWSVFRPEKIKELKQHSVTRSMLQSARPIPNRLVRFCAAETFAPEI